MRRPTSPRPSAVLASGAATALWYATPDVIPSRTVRGWVKAGILTASLAVSAPELRAAWRDTRDQLAAVPGGEGAEAVRTPLPTRTKVVLAGAAAVGLTLAARGVAAAERWAFRHGQARAAAGKRLPHTGPALVYGAATVALWFVPVPADAD